MTYCLALKAQDGLVLLSDSRTNAGVDDVGVTRKLHLLETPSDRIIVLQSAGNLSTTQEVLDRLARDPTPIASAGHLFEVALHVGQLEQEVVAQHKDALEGADATASFIVSGQIGPAPVDLLMVYPEGNYLRASDDRPFLQIGETKYGKQILELGAAAFATVDEATKFAVASMVTTARENVAVGPPYDLALYREGTLDLQQRRFEEDDPYLELAAEVWERHLLAAIAELPTLDWPDPPAGAGDGL